MNVRSAAYAVHLPQEIADTPLRGMFLIAVGIAVFGIQDVIIRYLSADYAAPQIMFIRGLIALFPLSFLVYLSGGFSTLRVPHPLINIVRGLMMACSYMTFYVSLAVLPIAQVTAMFFVSPLIVTLFSVLFLGETVGFRRWLAVITGFVGVVFIVQPEVGTLDLFLLLPLAAAATYAGSTIITRHIGRSQTGASLAMLGMWVFIVVGGVSGLMTGDGRFLDANYPDLDFLLRAWMMPDGVGTLLITTCGFIAAFGFYCLSEGYRVAAPSVVAPFEFVSMPLAVMWGVILWDEYPSFGTLFGIGLIIVSGIYVMRREVAIKQAASLEDD